MTEFKEHSFIPKLKELLFDGKIDRREFLRTSTLLGLSATAAYAVVGLPPQEAWSGETKADLPKGGHLRIGMRIDEVANPHAADFAEKTQMIRQVCEYLTRTDADNITRPYLCERWEASEDLRTWTLYLRKDVVWRNGRRFTADDAIWNIKHVLDPATGSSVLGLMLPYMLDEYDTGEKDEKGQPKKSTRLWDANAIERADESTVRLNLKTPQLAVPEHLFHYPFFMLDPEEGGTFKPGSNGTGAFELVDITVGQSAKFKARKDYWGEGPYLDSLEFIDMGDSTATAFPAMASKQIDGLFETSTSQREALKQLPHVQLYQTPTSQTGLARGKVDQKPFDDPRVRKALRLAINRQQAIDVGLNGFGVPAEHHHVSPIHPEYAKLPPTEQNIEEAKRLLAEAGYPGGFETEIVCRGDPVWELNTVQGLVEQWRAIGVKASIRNLPTPQYWEVWDKAPFSFTAWGHRPLGVMVLSLAYRTGVPWNESGYSNPEFDRLLTEAEGTLDIEKRREIMAKIERIMQEDGPITQPFWTMVSTAYDKRVKGFKMHPSQYIFANELAIES